MDKIFNIADIDQAPTTVQITLEPELLNLVLNEFQTALRNNLDNASEFPRRNPPKYGYIEQTEYVTKPLRKGSALRAWHFSATTMRPTLIKETSIPKSDGTFFNLFYGSFCFAPNFSAVYINWQTGPLFGRGFRHRIGRDTLGSYLLGRGSGTWVS